MSHEILMLVTGLAAILLLLCVLLLLGMYGKIRKSNEALIRSYHELEELNTVLRAQRHDQLNHLQIVYGMAELGEYDEIAKYLKPIYLELQKTGKALKTSRPAVNALIMAKQQAAEKNGIDFFVEVKSSLEGLKIQDWELCKVLSNLIDNAVTALLEKPEDRSLRVDITEDRDAFIFEISNNGPEIPREALGQLFKQGFSTKKEEGHGMGLAIVKRTLADAGGEISCHSDPSETVFTVRIVK